MGLSTQYKGNTFTMESGEAITKYACVTVSGDGTVQIPAAANATGFVGVALEAVSASGLPVLIAGIGSIVPVVVGVTGMDYGDQLIIHGASGRVTEVGTTSGSAYNVIGMALSSSDTAGNQIIMLVNPYYERAQG